MPLVFRYTLFCALCIVGAAPHQRRLCDDVIYGHVDDAVTENEDVEEDDAVCEGTNRRTKTANVEAVEGENRRCRTTTLKGTASCKKQTG